MDPAGDTEWRAKVEHSFQTYDKALKSVSANLQEIAQQLAALRSASTPTPPASPSVIHISTEPPSCPLERDPEGCKPFLTQCAVQLSL